MLQLCLLLVLKLAGVPPHPPVKYHSRARRLVFITIMLDLVGGGGCWAVRF